MNFIQKREDLLTQYSKVFNESGEVMICGRAQCIALIDMCEKFKPNNNVDYGNVNTGMMNIENIRELITSLL